MNKTVLSLLLAVCSAVAASDSGGFQSSLVAAITTELVCENSNVGIVAAALPEGKSFLYDAGTLQCFVVGGESSQKLMEYLLYDADAVKEYGRQELMRNMDVGRNDIVFSRIKYAEGVSTGFLIRCDAAVRGAVPAESEQDYKAIFRALVGLRNFMERSQS